MKPRLAESVGDRQLLWIDLLGRDVADLEAVAAAAGIEKTLAQRLTEETGRADLTQYPEYIHLVLEAMEAASETSESSDDPLAPQRRAIDLIAGRNWVVTIHTEASPALQRIDDLTRGPTQFGALDAGGFLAAIVDEVLAGYLGLAEAIEQEIDRLDERTLRTKPRGDVLARIVMLRRRIGTIRRALTPHRLAFAALARPQGSSCTRSWVDRSPG